MKRWFQTPKTEGDWREIADDFYISTNVSVGAQGRASDSGIFAQTDFKRALDKGLLNLPSAKPLPGSATGAPFMFLETMHTLSVVTS